MSNSGASASTVTTPSIWEPLRIAGFRALWTSGALYFIGNAMQSTTAAWTMLEMTNSAFLAALVQTAVFLPMFVLVLPAGVLADTTDRRRLMLGALLIQACASAALAALHYFHMSSPSVLLSLIFVSGCCTAVLSPAWNSTVADYVPRAQMAQAITVVGVAYNAARAAGPALAGVVLATAGGELNFLLAVVGTANHFRSVRRWPPFPPPASRLPPERLWTGTVAALRFTWHSHLVLPQLLRTVAFSTAGAALWALLPAIGQQQLGLEAAGYGMLMGCLGSGAVVSGLLMGRMRNRVGIERMTSYCCVVYACVMLVAALSHSRAVVYASLVVGGAAWMAAMSTFSAATQTSVPPWIRGRAAAMQTLSALGSFAIGSAVWGALSSLTGLPVALSAAALGMAAGLLLARRFPMRVGDVDDVTPAAAWDKLFVRFEPEHDAGPVAVEIQYRVEPARAAEFVTAVAELRKPRKRDGATFWRLYHDLGEPSIYVERFIVSSWADYLRQRARTTVADQEKESRVRALLVADQPVVIRHYLAEA